jgi:hypothetical protein
MAKTIDQTARLLTTERLLVVISLMVGPACLPTWAKDWPQWGGSPTRNMVSDARDLPISFNPGRPKSSASGLTESSISPSDGVKWAVGYSKNRR